MMENGLIDLFTVYMSMCPLLQQLWQQHTEFEPYSYLPPESLFKYIDSKDLNLIA